MSDRLNDPELGLLIAEIAALTGEAPGAIVRKALEERIERLRVARTRADELGELALRHAGLDAAADVSPDSIPRYLGAAN